MIYFGDPWPSGICEDGQQGETPVGEACLWCDEAVVEGDQGVMMGCYTADERAEIRPSHKECWLRSVVGSWGHLTKVCHCYGGELEDPPGLTRRESGKLVWDWVQRHGVSAP